MSTRAPGSYQASERELRPWPHATVLPSYVRTARPASWRVLCVSVLYMTDGGGVVYFELYYDPPPPPLARALLGRAATV